MPATRSCAHTLHDVAISLTQRGDNVRLRAYRVTPSLLDRGPYRPILIAKTTFPLARLGDFRAFLQYTRDTEGIAQPFQLWLTDGWFPVQDIGQCANVHLTLYKGLENALLEKDNEIHRYTPNTAALKPAITELNRYLEERLRTYHERQPRVRTPAHLAAAGS